MDPLYSSVDKNQKIKESDWEILKSIGDPEANICGRTIDFAIHGSRLEDVAAILSSYRIALEIFLVFAPLERMAVMARTIPPMQNIHLPQIAFTITKIAASILLIKYILSRLVMTILYPAQSRIARFFKQILAPSPTFNICEPCLASPFLRSEETIQHVVLKNRGVKYHGVLFAHKSNILNRQWVLISQADRVAADRYAVRAGRWAASAGFNVLIMDGPAAGRSHGHANPKTMADAIEVGIQYLETRIRADRICFVGIKDGGLMLGEALKAHEFKENIEYRSVTENGITKRSAWGGFYGRIIAGSFGQKIGENLIHFLGLEMDSIAASKRLDEKKIEQWFVMDAHDTQSARYGAYAYAEAEQTSTYKHCVRREGKSKIELLQSRGVIQNMLSYWNAVCEHKE